MTDTMIKKFEAWLKQQWSNRADPFLRSCNDVDPQHTYQDQDTELAYIAWQAAQTDARALVGELANDFVWVREYIRRYVIIHPASTTDGATPEQKICSVINKALTKAQAFMEGK